MIVYMPFCLSLSLFVNYTSLLWTVCLCLFIIKGGGDLNLRGANPVKPTILAHRHLFYKCLLDSNSVDCHCEISNSLTKSKLENTSEIL